MYDKNNLFRPSYNSANGNEITFKIMKSTKLIKLSQFNWIEVL